MYIKHNITSYFDTLMPEENMPVYLTAFAVEDLKAGQVTFHRPDDLSTPDGVEPDEERAFEDLSNLTPLIVRRQVEGDIVEVLEPLHGLVFQVRSHQLRAAE